MPAEVPYTDIVDSGAATSPEALSSLSSVDVSLPQSTASSSASGNEKLFSPANVPHNLRPNTLSSTKDMYWFAHTGEQAQGGESEGSPVGGPNPEDPTASPPTDAAGVRNPTAGAGRGALSPGHSESKEESAARLQRDHELRLRYYKEWQEEERLRKLTELQAASQQAQRFREQQEEDRRRKIDELRSKDIERRQAVEERKRLIWEAEQERKEAILRRNLEREAKIEARRNAQRNTASVAFGSTTPREIDLPTGMAVSRGNSFGSMMVLSSGGSHPVDLYKRRTPSADVLDKDSDPMTQSLVILPGNRGRRKTDLTPTIPWERDMSARSSSPGNPLGGSRSQTKRAVSMSRLDILAQPRRRPSANADQSAQGAAAAAGSTAAHSRNLQKDLNSPSRPRSSQSMASEQSVTSTVSMRSQLGPRRARPISIAGSIVPANMEAGQVHQPLPPQRRSRTAERKAPAVVPPARPPRAKSLGPEAAAAAAAVAVAADSVSTPPKAAPRKPPQVPKSASAKVEKEPDTGSATKEANSEAAQHKESPSESIQGDLADTTTQPKEQTPDEPAVVAAVTAIASVQSSTNNSTSVTPKAGEAKEVPAVLGKTPRITSEEEAKAALAEKRRLAREQAEREAEMERQRQEELRRQEEERIRLEEEEQRRLEEEQLRLAEELRKQEEDKLQRAIEEQKKREEEDRLRREEENKLRIEKEEQERKLREEAEKQRKELEEKLRQEEEARAERKKRVEQIMKRTRNKNENNQKADDLEKTSDATERGSSPVPSTEMPSSTALVEGTEQDLPSKPSQLVNVLPLADSETLEKVDNVVNVNGLNNVTDGEVKVATTEETSAAQDRFQGDVVNGVGKPKIPVNSEDTPQTNGYSTHDVNLFDVSPDDKSHKDLNPLLDFTVEEGSSESHWNPSPPPPPTEFEQLIDLGLGVANQNEVNRLNNADELNSNRVPTIPFIAFEENVTRKQESTITDLLS